MLDVHSLKYEAHGKFGKRNRCLRVPQCVSGNSLCHAMYTHTHTSLTFAPAQMIVKYVNYNFSQFSIHIFIWFEEILTNLCHSLSQVRDTSFLGVISSYEPLPIKQSLYISDYIFIYTSFISDTSSCSRISRIKSESQSMRCV